MLWNNILLMEYFTKIGNILNIQKVYFHSPIFGTLFILKSIVIFIFSIKLNFIFFGTSFEKHGITSPRVN